MSHNKTKIIQGLLISNSTLTTGKYQQINQMYIDAANKMDIKLHHLVNTQVISSSDNEIYIPESNIKLEQIEFVLFLDKDIRLAKHLEASGLRLFNSSAAIEICDDKDLTISVLSAHGIATPKSFSGRLVYKYADQPMTKNQEKYLEEVAKKLGYPMIVKENKGSFGHQVYKADNEAELFEIVNKINTMPHHYQEYIKSSHGEDVRVQIVGGKVIASVKRVSKDDFRANVTNGGEMFQYNPSQAYIDIAIKAAKAVNADFAGVDILQGENGEPIICEINSNAHIKNLFNCTNIDVSESILEYIASEVR